MTDGQINYINFGGNKGREINCVHLAVLFTIPNIKDLVFCVPLTSPKIKHFKSEEDFINRNYRNVKHFNLQYLKQTDSIALLDQMKIISTLRIIKSFKNEEKIPIVLDNNTQKILKLKIFKYLDAILNKKI